MSDLLILMKVALLVTILFGVAAHYTLLGSQLWMSYHHLLHPEGHVLCIFELFLHARVKHGLV